MNSALWYIAGIFTVYSVNKAFNIWGKRVLNSARTTPDNIKTVVESMSHTALLKWRDAINNEIIRRRES